MVKITEPMTMITDYIIAIYTVILIFLLLETSVLTSTALWIISLAFLCVGAVLGGTDHGFQDNFTEKTIYRIKQATYLCIGMASLFMLLGTIYSSISNEIVIIVFVAISIIKSMIFIYNIRSKNQFKYVIIEYAPSMVLVLIFKIYSLIVWNDPSSIWIIIGVIISFISAAIQASKFSLHKHFNHNDIYHVVQMIGIYFFYKGILLFTTP
ncbi:MAG: hypothetical protein OEZ01_15620 [Candidatus Heimdallarchaeota archaeon]|nr:hypothetical protein [Candidatus Heimdallarchaeota archaeon]